MTLHLHLKLLRLSWFNLLFKMYFILIIFGLFNTHVLMLRTVIYFNVELFYIVTIIVSTCTFYVLSSTCGSWNVLFIVRSFILSSFWTYSWLYSSRTRYRPLLISVVTRIRSIVIQSNILLSGSRSRFKISSIYLSILLDPILLVFSLSFQFLLHFLSNFIIHSQFSSFFTWASVNIWSNSITRIRFLTNLWSAYLVA